MVKLQIDGSGTLGQLFKESFIMSRRRYRSRYRYARSLKLKFTHSSFVSLFICVFASLTVQRQHPQASNKTVTTIAFTDWLPLHHASTRETYSHSLFTNRKDCLDNKKFARHHTAVVVDIAPVL
jgi:hypothetical protein